MISPRGAFILVSILVLLAASAALGFVVHQRTSAAGQLAEPGWCCVPTSDALGCTVSQGSNACRDEGGVNFNWDQSACNVACKSVRSQAKKMKPRTP